MWRSVPRWGIAMLGCAFVLSGCITSQHDELIFAAADLDDPNPDLKFYRVKIDARAVNNETNLQTGFFDADAVRGLYGEVPVTRSDADPFLGTGVASQQLFFDSGTGKWEPVENEVFTVVYGADASVMASQIQDFATALNTGDTLGRLLGAAVAGDLYADTRDATQKNAANKEAMALTAGQLDDIASGVGATPVAATAQAELLKAATTVAKALAKLSGIPQADVPTTLPGLETFIRQQVDRFLAEEN